MRAHAHRSLRILLLPFSRKYNPVISKYHEHLTDADSMFLILSSGSTGTPKAIILTHASVCTSITRIAEAFRVNNSSRILQFASFAFDASLSDILTGLFSGAKICMPSDDERRDDLQAYMHREQINLAWLTPTVARMLDPATTSTHLRQLVLIGEAIAQPDISRWMQEGVAVYNGYGPAEVSPLSSPSVRLTC